MKRSTPLVLLSALICLLILAAAAAGLLWADGGEPVAATTVRGDRVTLYGRGLYRYDSLFTGAAFHAQDAVTLALAFPLLVATTLYVRRGTLRGLLLHLGVLSYVLYVYASMTFAAAYNPLFLLYTALFSLSLYAFILAFSGARALWGPYVAAALPRLGPALYFLLAGLGTAFVWLDPLLRALLAGGVVERVERYTTPVTYGLDLAVIVPACFLAAVAIWRRRPLGYVTAFPLLGLILFLGPVIALSTLLQIRAGIAFTPGEVVGPIAAFLLMSLLAVWVVVAILRRLPAR